MNQTLRIEEDRASYDDHFSFTVKARVEDYFLQNKKSDKANLAMVLKTSFYLGTYFLSYALMMSNQLSGIAFYSLWVILGFMTAGIGFNIGHDALHGAYSKSPVINRIFGATFFLLGANTRIWRILHNMIHHSYTNMPGADGDLYPVPALRFHSSSPRRNFHRYQYLYAPILYCFTSLIWVFRKDFSHFFKESHFGHPYPKIKPGELRTLLIAKGLYYSAFLILPLIFLSVPWWSVLLGFLCMHIAAGFSLAIVFQLGHIVEGPEYLEFNKTSSSKVPWAVHQLRSAANFSTSSRLALFLFGGLNFQIEHHLFPKVCHMHYPMIASIVKETALESGLPYYEHKNFLAAVRSHQRVLKQLGIADQT